MQTKTKVIIAILAGALVGMSPALIVVPSVLNADSGAKCPPTKMINESDEDWLPFDFDRMEVAKQGCIARFGVDGECIAAFYKYGPDRYGVLCSAKETLADEAQ